MKRRNADCGKLRRPMKRNKITESVYGSTTVLYMKFLMLWAIVLTADFMFMFRFEFLWPFWLLLRSVHDSFKYKGLAFSVLFVCIAITSDLVCLFFIPVHWLLFAASTYVWVQYVWHTGICLPTIILWMLFVYIEAGIRWKDNRHIPHLDLCRPFAAHCIGYPVVTLGFGFKTYVGYRMRQRKQREVSKENEFYMQLLQQALPQEEALDEAQISIGGGTTADSSVSVVATVSSTPILSTTSTAITANGGSITAVAVSINNHNSNISSNSIATLSPSNGNISVAQNMNNSIISGSMSSAATVGSMTSCALATTTSPSLFTSTTSSCLATATSALLSTTIGLTSGASSKSPFTQNAINSIANGGNVIMQNTHSNPHYQHANHHHHHHHNQQQQQPIQQSISDHQQEKCNNSSNNIGSGSTHNAIGIANGHVGSSSGGNSGKGHHRRNTDKENKHRNSCALLPVSTGDNSETRHNKSHNNYQQHLHINDNNSTSTNYCNNNNNNNTNNCNKDKQDYEQGNYQIQQSKDKHDDQRQSMNTSWSSSSSTSTSTKKSNGSVPNGNVPHSYDTEEIVVVELVERTKGRRNRGKKDNASKDNHNNHHLQHNNTNSHTNNNHHNQKEKEKEKEREREKEKDMKEKDGTNAIVGNLVTNNSDASSVASSTSSQYSDKSGFSTSSSSSSTIGSALGTNANAKFTSNTTTSSLTSATTTAIANLATKVVTKICESCIKFEADIKKYRAEIANQKQIENELRQKLEMNLTTKSCLQAKQRECDDLEKRLQDLNNVRHSDMLQLQATERRLTEERRQKQSLEAQLNNEKKARKTAEEKSLRPECSAQCKQKKQQLDEENKKLKQDLKLTEEAKDLAEQQNRKTELEFRLFEEQIRNRDSNTPGTEILMNALAAMQDKYSTLEKNLSAETRVKLDLFSALGDAKRQLEICESVRRARDDEVLDLKAKIAQILAVMPTESLCMPGCGPNSNSILRMNGTPPLQPGPGPASPMLTSLSAAAQQQACGVNAMNSRGVVVSSGDYVQQGSPDYVTATQHQHPHPHQQHQQQMQQHLHQQQQQHMHQQQQQQQQHMQHHQQQMHHHVPVSVGTPVLVSSNGGPTVVCGGPGSSLDPNASIYTPKVTPIVGTSNAGNGAGVVTVSNSVNNNGSSGNGVTMNGGGVSSDA